MPTSSNHIQSTTQEFIDIYDITNDIIIMKDGACSLVLTVDALNFGLLAEEEQDAIMYSYAGLLNSLNYPIQIVIRSQTKDATNYLNLLKDQELKASSELKKSQIRAYAGFVADLIRERNVLDKKFYIVIPASALEMGLLPPATVVPGVKQIDISTVEKSVILDKAKTILEPKRDHLVSQFGRIGLFARQLNTQEIIQLFYTSYNPEAAEGQQITNSNDYTTPLVTGQMTMTEVAAPMPTPQLEVSQPPQAMAQPPQAAAQPEVAQPEVAQPFTEAAATSIAPDQTQYPAPNTAGIPETSTGQEYDLYQASMSAPVAEVPAFSDPTLQAPTYAPVPESAPTFDPTYTADSAGITSPTATAPSLVETPIIMDQVQTDPALEMQQLINSTAQQVQPLSETPAFNPGSPLVTTNPAMTPSQSTNLPPLPEI